MRSPIPKIVKIEDSNKMECIMNADNITTPLDKNNDYEAAGFERHRSTIATWKIEKRGSIE